MATHGSITEWLIQLKAGSGDEAARQLWQRCFARLVDRARALLDARPRPLKDEEDVALSAFDSFVRGVKVGSFPDLDSRNDLWQVLFMLTRRKAADLIDWEKARQPRNGQLHQLSAIRADKQGSSANGFEPVSPEPDPAEAQAMSDSLCEMLKLLGDETLQRVAVLKMERYTNAEIADKIKRSVKAVERKLRLIRTVFVDAGIWHD